MLSATGEVLQPSEVLYKKPILVGRGSLYELPDEKYYTKLEGGILESSRRLFKNDLKLALYPLLNRDTGELTTVENIPIPVDKKVTDPFITPVVVRIEPHADS